MARLPVPGADDNVWGDVLNEYLLESHTSSGSLKSGSVTAVTLANGSVTSNVISNNSITPQKLSSDTPAGGEILSYNGAGFEWITPQAASGSGEVNTASNIGSGGVGIYKQKTGEDLELKRVRAGSTKVTITDNTGNNTVDLDVDTAQLGLTKANVGLANVDNTTDLAKPVSTATQTALSAKADSTITVTGATSITGGGALTANRTVSLVNDSASPGNSQYYGTNGSGTKGYFALPGGADPTVGGDLTGTASNAQIATGAIVNADINASAAIAQSKVANLTTDLAAKANTTHTHAASDITSGTVATARLGSGTANGSTYLRGDGTWAAVSAGGLTAVAASGNITAASGNVIIGNAASAGFTVTLPAPSNGATVTVKKVDSSGNAIVVMRSGVNIDDQVSVVVNTQWQSMDFFSDGTQWYRI